MKPGPKNRRVKEKNEATNSVVVILSFNGTLFFRQVNIISSYKKESAWVSKGAV